MRNLLLIAIAACAIPAAAFQDAGETVGNRESIQSNARLEIRLLYCNPLFRSVMAVFPEEHDAIQAFGGALPPDAVLMHGREVAASGEFHGRIYVVGRASILSGSDFRDARPTTDENGRLAVDFNLNTTGREKFAAFTRDHNERGTDPNHFMAIVLDNRVRAAASIREEIQELGRITRGDFTEENVRDLSTLLKSGSLPINADGTEERRVGPAPGAAKEASANKIPVHSRVYIAPMGGFENDLKIAIQSKKVPVELVTERNSADYEIAGTAEAGKTGASGEQGGLTVSGIKSGETILACSVSRESSAHRRRSAAEACARGLRERIKEK